MTAVELVCVDGCKAFHKPVGRYGVANIVSPPHGGLTFLLGNRSAGSSRTLTSCYVHPETTQIGLTRRGRVQ